MTTIGLKVLYFNKPCIILQEDRTHVVIQFESGAKIATPRSTFKELDGIYFTELKKEKR